MFNMNLSPTDFLSAAIRLESVPVETVTSLAYAALDSAGIEFGLASAGPEDRLREFLQEHVIPRVKAAGERWGVIVRETEDLVRKQIPEYLEKMKAEGYAGFNTARVVATAATADALAKLLMLQGLSATDWVMIAIFYRIYFHSPSSES
jgi:hypothetical protein